MFLGSCLMVIMQSTAALAILVALFFLPASLAISAPLGCGVK